MADSPRPAPHVERLEPFLAMEIMERAFELEASGSSVIHLEIGEPDFPPPSAAVAACEQALRDGETHYTDSRGLLALREAIAGDYARRFAVEVDPAGLEALARAEAQWGARAGGARDPITSAARGAPQKLQPL